MAVPDAAKVFPAGSFYISNLSPLPVRMQLESKTYEFKPSQATLVENPPVRANGQIGMRAAIQKDGNWSEISSSLWTHPGQARSFMILYYDPEFQSVRLKAFDDIKPRASKPAKVP